MRPSFYPRLVNGPFDDPGVFVPMTFRKRALLFDLGDLSPLSAGDILKISHIFVTHTHMDHFIGFDQVLRLLLGRGKSLHLFGPRGFLENMRAKMGAYTWNLVHNYAEGLTITATEIRSQCRTIQTFDCKKGFAPSRISEADCSLPTVHEEPGFTIKTAILDHQIPSLAYALEERFHINILKSSLDELGLTVGPWVSRFKELLYRQVDPATEIEVQHSASHLGRAAYPIAELSPKITRITPGQKIGYVADCLYSPENEEKVVELVEGADHLFIEAAFLEKDRDVAREKCHLTAHQAGVLARRAGVREMTVFHHSPRYSDEGHLLQEEANNAFRGL